MAAVAKSGLVRVILVSDDPTLAPALARLLRPRYAATLVRSARAARSLVEAEGEAFALIVIDEPTESERAALPTLPVLVLTRHPPAADATGSAPEGRVLKPVRIPALIAELDRLLRRADRGNAIDLAGFRFLPDERLLIPEPPETPVRLTEKEAAILDLLVRAEGATVARGALLQHIWGHAEGVTSHTLETHIYRLRRKIDSDPARAPLVLSVEGGYRIAPQP